MLVFLNVISINLHYQFHHLITQIILLKTSSIWILFTPRNSPTANEGNCIRTRIHIFSIHSLRLTFRYFLRTLRAHHSRLPDCQQLKTWPHCMPLTKHSYTHSHIVCVYFCVNAIFSSAFFHICSHTSWFAFKKSKRRSKNQTNKGAYSKQRRSAVNKSRASTTTIGFEGKNTSQTMDEKNSKRLYTNVYCKGEGEIAHKKWLS